MKIAILVPAYNAERFLAPCIDSILMQRGCEADVFCCDDGSTDGTLSLLKRLAAENPRVHAFSKPNGGVVSALNFLLDQLPVDFDVFGIVDSDDYIHPAMLETLASALEETGSDVAECAIANVPADAVCPEGLSTELLAPTKVIDDLTCYWLRRTAPGGWINKNNKLYRRSAVGHLRFRAGLSFEEDYFYGREVNAVIQRKVLVPQALYAYRSNPASATSTLNLRRYFESTSERIRLTCEVFLDAGRVPRELEAEFRADLAKDAYRMVIRKNLKKNRNPAERRELFLAASAFFQTLERERAFCPVGLNPVQLGVYVCCRKGWYGLARLLVALT